MDTNQKNNLFAPPTKQELGGEQDLFAPPTEQELGEGQNLFAPPTQEELGKDLSGIITESELDALVKKHNLSPDQLGKVRNELPSMGAITPTSGALDTASQALKYGIGSAGRIVGVQGIASKLSREGIPGLIKPEDPNVVRALEEAQDLINSRKSGLETGMELAGGLVAPTLGGKTAAARAIGGGIVGALQGYGASKEGEEALNTGAGTLIGGGLAAILPPAFQATGKVLGKLQSRLVGNTAKKFEEAAVKVAPELDKVMSDAVVKAEPELAQASKLLATSKELSPNELAAVAPEISNLVPKQLTREQLIQALPTSVVKELGDVSDDVLRQAAGYEVFKKQVSSALGKSFPDAINEHSPEFIKRQLQRGIEEEAALRAINSTQLKRIMPKLSILDKVVGWFSDGKPYAQMVDNLLGTRLETTLDDGARNLSRFTLTMSSEIPKIQEVIKPLQAKYGDKLFRVLEDPASTGDPLVTEFRKLTESLRETANAQGLRVQNLADEWKAYVPNMRLVGTDYQMTMNKLVPFAEQLATRSPEDFAQLVEANPIITQLNGAAVRLKDMLTEANRFGKVKSGDDLLHFIKSASEGVQETSQKSNIQASAAMAREGQIPEFILDRDVQRVMNRYVQGTFKAAALQDVLPEINKISRLADAAGLGEIAKHYRNLVADMTGTRQGTLVNWIQDVQNKVALKAAKTLANPEASTASKILAAGAQEIPGITAALNQFMYANALGGLAAKQNLQNFVSPFLMNLPELGAYGTEVSVRALAQLAKEAGTGVKIRLSPSMALALNAEKGTSHKAGDIIPVGLFGGKALENAGLSSRPWTAEMVSALQTGLKSSGLRKLSQSALDKYVKASMSLFHFSEGIARSTAFNMGQVVGADLVKGSKGALKFLENMPSRAYRKSIQEAIASGNKEQVKDLVSQYFIHQNMLSYDRLSMSDYGRSMGPLFSVFSKWPTNTVGRAYAAYMQGASPQRKQAVFNMLAPLFALASADLIINQATDLKEEPVYQGLVGRGGLRSYAPAAGLLDFGGNISLGSAPAFKTLGRVGSTATSMMYEDRDIASTTARMLDKVLETWTFAGLIKKSIADKQRFIDNQEPSKQSPGLIESLTK